MIITHAGLLGKITSNVCDMGVMPNRVGTMHAGAMVATFNSYPDSTSSTLTTSGISPLAKITPLSRVDFLVQGGLDPLRELSIAITTGKISIAGRDADICSGAYDIRLNAQNVFINFDDNPDQDAWNGKFSKAASSEAPGCSLLRDNNVFITTSAGYKKEHLDGQGRSIKIHPDLLSEDCKSNVIKVGSTMQYEFQ